MFDSALFLYAYTVLHNRIFTGIYWNMDRIFSYIAAARDSWLSSAI